jgi:hypothetical protein
MADPPTSRLYDRRVLVRFFIRIVSSLAGIAVGMGVADAFLEDFTITAGGFVKAVGLFWIVHLVVTFLALRVLIRQPSIAMAGLLALATTVISLVIVALVVNDFEIKGVSTYVLATLIIWVSTAIGDFVGQRMIRARREDRRS